MAKSLLLAHASPSSREAIEEFNTWYEQTHIPELRQIIPAIGRVSRYVVAGDDAADGPPRYLAVYEIEDGDVAEAARALGEATRAGQLTMSSAMDVHANPPDLRFYQGV